MNDFETIIVDRIRILCDIYYKYEKEYQRLLACESIELENDKKIVLSGGCGIVCEHLKGYKWKWNEDTDVICEFKSIEPVYYNATNICIDDKKNIFDYLKNPKEYKTVKIDFSPNIDLAFERNDKITLIEIKISSDINNWDEGIEIHNTSYATDRNLGKIIIDFWRMGAVWIKSKEKISNICYIIAFSEKNYSFDSIKNLTKPDYCTATTFFTQGYRINVNKITSKKFIDNNKSITSICSRFTGNEESLNGLNGDDLKNAKKKIINNYKKKFENIFYGNNKESNHWDEWHKPCNFVVEQVGGEIRGKKRSAILLKIAFSEN